MTALSSEPAEAFVSRHPAYSVEPWQVRETYLDQDLLARSESIFALSNGHIGLRGNLDEGDPHGMPGTYLNSFYELRPLPYAEGGYGYPESGQTIVNVTNGKLIRLLVDDEPFDVQDGGCGGTNGCSTCAPACCTGRWSGCPRPGGRSGCARPGWCRSPSGRSPRSSTRSTPVDAPVRLIVQSELVANEKLPARASDPRVVGGAGRRRSWPRSSCDAPPAALLVHRTGAAACAWPPPWTTSWTGPPGLRLDDRGGDRTWARTTVACRLAARASGCAWSS